MFSLQRRYLVKNYFSFFFRSCS